MPNINEGVEIARKLLPIIYILDTSGSMTGDRISSVNEAMHDTVELLKEVAEKEPSADIKMGVLQFATNAKWVTNGLISPDNFFWNDLSAAGLTDLGAALAELNDKLSRRAWLTSDVGFKAPVLIFMSDGCPTDDYVSALEKIKAENLWYQVSTKISIAVGDDADRGVLEQISGNREAVIEVNDSESLKQLIKVVSVTASQIGSKSHVTDNNLSEIIKNVNDIMGSDAGVTIADPVVDTSSATDTNDDSSEDNTGWPVDGDFNW